MPNAEEAAVLETANQLDMVTGGAAPEPTVEPPKDKPKDKKAENELLESMMFSPSSSNADPTLNLDSTTDDKDNSKDAKELLKVLEKGEGKVSEKYQKELLEKALKDPMSVEVETPRGWMTVREAIEQGFDLSTGEFSGEQIAIPDWESAISQLDPREQATIRGLSQQNTPQAGPSPITGAEEAEMSPEGQAALPPEAMMGDQPGMEVPTEDMGAGILGGVEGGM